MRADTNMAWPDDPYGTGQLWRKEPWLLAGFAIRFLTQEQRMYPVSYAVAYLRLHRTQAIDLTSGVSFGFRAVTIDTHAELGHLLQLFDLDAMRARRLAKIVAGWRLADDLAAMHAQAGREAVRGIKGLAESWVDRRHVHSAFAQMCDVAYDKAVPVGDVATAATQSHIDISGVREACESPSCLDMSPGAWSTTRALIYGLMAGRTLNRFSWQGSLNVGAAIESNAGDSFTAQDFGHRAQSA
jgi:hypothetical protein